MERARTIEARRGGHATRSGPTYESLATWVLVVYLVAVPCSMSVLFSCVLLTYESMCLLYSFSRGTTGPGCLCGVVLACALLAVVWGLSICCRARALRITLVVYRVCRHLPGQVCGVSRESGFWSKPNNTMTTNCEIGVHSRHASLPRPLTPRAARPSALQLACVICDTRERDFLLCRYHLPPMPPRLRAGKLQ